MTRNLIMPLVIVLLLWEAVPVSADGLLYQLPVDGAWVLFDTKVTMTRGDQKRDATGQLRMASVGTATADGKKCRWIEFKLAMKVDDNERVIVAKVLVPELHLNEGQKPVENRVRGWIRLGEGTDVVELTEQNLGPIPGFMANPLTDVELLEAKLVESPLGKLSCVGLTGRAEFVEGTSTNKAT
ncbi:MAG: hypothetical protein O3C40_16445 [Planctomycetota bacterium]|nr:hypothetical protein [Planctomycetota bacterium]